MALAREPGALTLGGTRAQHATRATAAVILAVTIACAMSLPDVWWAAISAGMSTMPTRPASLEKGLLRIIGTMAGALSGYPLIGWIAYDHAACCLALFAVSAIALYGMAVSPHGYAWMLLGVTFNLVVLVSLNDPSQAFSVAVYRVLEVLVGTACALLVAILLAPEADDTDAPVLPGWRDPFGAQWPAVTYAMRSGVMVAALPVIWNTFNLPGIATMATTVAAVMAVPMLPGHVLDDPARILSKAAYRLLGCFVGGVAGLAVLAVSPTVFSCGWRCWRQVSGCSCGCRPARPARAMSERRPTWSISSRWSRDRDPLRASCRGSIASPGSRWGWSRCCWSPRCCGRSATQGEDDDRHRSARGIPRGAGDPGGPHARSAARRHRGAVAARRGTSHLRAHHDDPRCARTDPRTGGRSVAADRRRHGAGPRHRRDLPGRRRALHRRALDRCLAGRAMPGGGCGADAGRADADRGARRAGGRRRCGEGVPRVLGRWPGAYPRAAQRVSRRRVLPDRRRRTRQRRRLSRGRRRVRRHGRRAGRREAHRRRRPRRDRGRRRQVLAGA